MKTIHVDGFDPYFNLALEEYLLKHPDFSDDLFFLWRNQKCVIIGRNQNPYNEINLEYAKENDIRVVRRSTGGGCVYHDEGNINFTFLSSQLTNRLNQYEYFLAPLITLLRKKGLNAVFVPKTHIFVDEYKVSGNAQTFYKNKMIHHGTLLFDVNQTHLKSVLENHNVFDTVAISSTRASVANISDLLEPKMSVEDFMEYILSEMGIQECDTITLTKQEIKDIEELADTKYRSWDWVFGQTPKFMIEKNAYCFTISGGIITEASHFKEYLIGAKYQKESITELLQQHKDKEQIIDILFP